MKILLVEDNQLLGTSIKQGLEEIGWTVDLACDGEEGLFLARNSSYHMLLIDRMLPKISGIDLITNARSLGVVAPAIIITARGALEDRVSGLEVADDYLVKPFEMAELIARVKALYRRSLGKTAPVLAVGGLVINLAEQSATIDNAPLLLTHKEFELLEILTGRADQVCTRAELGGLLYTYEDEPESNSLDVLIARLRKKLDGSGVAIVTIRSKGFVLRVAQTPTQP